MFTRFSVLCACGDTRRSGFSRLCERLVMITACICCAAVLYYALEFRGMDVPEVVLTCAAAVILFALSVLLYRMRWHEQRRLAAVLVICFLARLAYVLLIPTHPFSDFELLYSAAASSAAGDFSWAADPSGYFGLWTYQIPFVLYQALILRLFGSIWALKIMNLLFMTGTDYLIYLIARRFLSENAAVCSAALYAVWPGSFHLAPVLTNQHISVFFTLLAIYLLLTEHGLPRFIAAGILLALGDLMRPEGIIFITALLGCALCIAVSDLRKENLLRLLAGCVLLLASYFLFKRLCALVLGLCGAAPNGIGSGFREWKFILGLDPDSELGGYSETHAALLEITDPALRSAQARAVISGYLARWRELPALFLRKMREMWGGEEDLNWSLLGLNSGTELLPGITVTGFRHYLRLWEKGTYILVWTLALGGCISMIKEPRKSGNLGAVLCAAVIVLAFAAYLLIEVQTRYRYFVMPFVFILASALIDRLPRKAGKGSP